MTNNTAFVFATSIKAHDSDVKCVFSLPKEYLNMGSYFLTGSRDHTVKLWNIMKDDSDSLDRLHINLVKIWNHHQHYVNALGYIPSDNPYEIDRNDDWIISAGSDKVIYAYPPPRHSRNQNGITDLDSDQPTYALIGHEDNICCLFVTLQRKILSASWDKTIRVWEDWKCQYVLKGHQQAVWTVSSLPNGLILSGSADKTIKMWSMDRCVATLTGHRDVVRQICILPSGDGFASCSNDATIMIWSENGTLLHEYSDYHTAYIYTITLFTSASSPVQLASAGEDNAIRLWNYTDKSPCIQCIQYPSGSIWSLSVCSLFGDLLIASSDGYVRIFTNHKDRMASQSTIQQFNELISSSKIHSSQLGDIDTETIPGPEVLNKPGKKEGSVVMIKQSNGSIGAYQWNSISSEWIHVGEVVNSSNKTIYQGKEYDYVFKIDLEDNKDPLSLPYNKDENPYTVAQSFIQQHDLPLSYLDQITNFIIRNTKTSKEIPKTEQFTVFRSVNHSGILKKLKEFNPRGCLTDDEFILISKLLTTQTILTDNDSKIFSSIIVKTKNWASSHIFPVLDCIRIFALNESTWKLCIEQDIFPNWFISILSLQMSDHKRNANLIARSLSNAFATSYGCDQLVSSIESVIQLYKLIIKYSDDIQCIEGFKKNLLLLSDSHSILLSFISELT